MLSMISVSVRVLIAFLVVFFVSLPYRIWASPYSTKGVYAQVDSSCSGMVVTSHPLASKVGHDVLKMGGNAIDAAVAVQFVLNVVEPMMSGIGGGGFMMIYDAKTKKVLIINSRERAPAGVKSDLFLDKEGNPVPFPKRHIYGKAVGVPGTLKGLKKALDLYGVLSMRVLIDPAIKMAQEGIPVNWVLAKNILENQGKLFRSAAKEVFMPEGKPLKEGDLLIQKDLAKTFRQIKKNGSDVLYDGPIGKAIVGAVQKFEGSMTIEDLKKYNVTIDQPVWGVYRGYLIASMPPPSSGGIILLEILNLLKDFDLSQYSARSLMKYHLIAEAMHLAYVDSGAYIGDPEFVQVPIKGLLSNEYINKRRSQISLLSARKNVKPGDPWEFDSVKQFEVNEIKDKKAIGQTSHFVIADRLGNIVSYTTTIEQPFGAGIMVPHYGFMLNNELTNFDAVPRGANKPEPNKRPRSSMAPTILFKGGKPFIALGSPGGPSIIASVLQVIINVIDYGMDLKKAIEEPRIFSYSFPNLQWELGIPARIRKALEQMGHNVNSKPTQIGNVQSIQIDQKKGVYLGAADSTRDGVAIGLKK